MRKKVVTLMLVMALVGLVSAGLAVGKNITKGKIPNGPAGRSPIAHLYFYEKDPDTWEIVEDGAPTDGVPPPGVFLVLRGSPSARWWWMVRGAAYARDDRPGPTEREVPGYAVLDAGAGYSLTDWLEVSLLGRNLFDRTYFASSDEDAVLAPGRSIQLVLRGRL